MSATFDASGYVAELRAIGCDVYPVRSRRDPERKVYGIASLEGFGEDFRAIVLRWNEAMRASPDHAEQIGAFLAGEAS